MRESFVFRQTEKALKALFRKHRLIGFDKPLVQPSVFVANHLMSYGPIAVILFFPLKTYPWVAHEMTEKGACAAYLEKDFVAKELHLGRPQSLWLARGIERFCLPIMRHLEAIPVQEGGRLAIKAIRQSADYLKRGRNILVFPENDVRPLNAIIHKFDSGFIEIGPCLYEETGRRLDFYPVGVNKQQRTLSLGDPVTFRPEHPLALEKRRMIAALEQRVTALCSSSAVPGCVSEKPPLFDLESIAEDDGITLEDVEA